MALLQPAHALLDTLGVVERDGPCRRLGCLSVEVGEMWACDVASVLLRVVDYVCAVFDLISNALDLRMQYAPVRFFSRVQSYSIEMHAKPKRKSGGEMGETPYLENSSGVSQHRMRMRAHGVSRANMRATARVRAHRHPQRQREGGKRHR